MLGDSILILIAMLLIVMGVQPMLEEANRKNSVVIVNSLFLVIAGAFLTFYWNSIVPS
jgi:hypothetical protein